jgi:hypothetical protein
MTVQMRQFGKKIQVHETYHDPGGEGKKARTRARMLGSFSLEEVGRVGLKAVLESNLSRPVDADELDKIQAWVDRVKIRAEKDRFKELLTSLPDDLLLLSRELAGREVEKIHLETIFNAMAVLGIVIRDKLHEKGKKT